MIGNGRPQNGQGRALGPALHAVLWLVPYQFLAGLVWVTTVVLPGCGRSANSVV